MPGGLKPGDLARQADMTTTGIATALTVVVLGFLVSLLAGWLKQPAWIPTSWVLLTLIPLLFVSATLAVWMGRDSDPAATTPLDDAEEIADIEITPLSGPLGSSVSVSGSDFKSGETVEIFFHAKLVGLVPADADGSFSTSIAVPDIGVDNPEFALSILAVGTDSFQVDTEFFMMTTTPSN